MQLDWCIIPSTTEFYPLGGTYFALHFNKFLVKPENLFTCASPEVKHSFKRTPTLWHYIFSDATKSTVCLQERAAL